MNPSSAEVTRLLKRLSEGDRSVLEELIPAVYEELHRIATNYMRHERPDHTLRSTDLVHEAYLQLVDQREVQWKNRSHFFGVAAKLMRRILVDYARSRQATKRGGAYAKVPLEQALALACEQPGSLLVLDELLNQLARLDAQQMQVVELRCFGGLSVEETSHVLDISPATVKRDWAMAKAWLERELRNGQFHN